MYSSKDDELNPNSNICFWCGTSKAEVLLFGNVYKHGEKATPNIVRDYEPCDACMEQFSQGILIVEASETPNVKNQPRLDQGYPTGNYWVVTREYIQRVFTTEAANQILAAGKAMLGHELAETLGFFDQELSA